MCLFDFMDHELTAACCLVPLSQTIASIQKFLHPTYHYHSSSYLQTREVHELQRQASDMDTQIQELKKAASKHQQQGAAIKRSFNSEQAAVEALKMRRVDLLGAAAMEQVLPWLDFAF